MRSARVSNGVNATPTRRGSSTLSVLEPLTADRLPQLFSGCFPGNRGEVLTHLVGLSFAQDVVRVGAGESSHGLSDDS
jgi:hypothetical protein